MDLLLDIKHEEKFVHVGVKGEIDLYSVKQLKEQVTELIERKKACNILLDLTDVNYIDSTGLGILIGIKRRCTERGGKVLLVSASERIMNLFGITGLNKIFTIFKTVEEATPNFD